MKKQTLTAGILSVATVGFALAGGSIAGDQTHGSMVAPQKLDVVDTAEKAGDFSTLVTAIRAAGLEDALKGPGPFTVFAPSDAAFSKLPAGTLDALLADKAKLTTVLTYHVVPGKLMAADVMKVDEAKTLQGKHLQVSTTDGVKVDQANVIKTDIVASNGVIHVIDAVVLPN